MDILGTSAWSIRYTLAFAVLLLVVGLAQGAHAQFSNGGIIVTVPRGDADAAPSKQRPPAARPPVKRAKPAPRRKRAPQRRAKRVPAPRPVPTGKLKIAVLVNDDPITHYEVTQRARLLSARAGVGKRAQAIFKSLIKQKSTNRQLRAILKRTIQQNQGKSREQILAIFEKRKRAFGASLQRRAVKSARARVLPTMRRKAVQELIDERLKIQAAKNVKLIVSDAEIDRVMTGIAKRNKLSLKQFKAVLRRDGSDVNSMRQRIRASIAWNRLVNAKFGRFIDVNQKAIDDSVARGNASAKTSLKLQQLILRLPKRLDQKAVLGRMVEAETLRTRFSGCGSTRGLARAARSAQFKDLGFRLAKSISEPTRSLLLNAKDGEMLPPVTTRDGITLYVVCARRSGNTSFAARDAAVRSIRQKGTEIYSRKYLTDLRRDALIEYR